MPWYLQALSLLFLCYTPPLENPSWIHGSSVVWMTFVNDKDGWYFNKYTIKTIKKWHFLCNERFFFFSTFCVSVSTTLDWNWKRGLRKINWHFCVMGVLFNLCTRFNLNPTLDCNWYTFLGGKMSKINRIPDSDWLSPFRRERCRFSSKGKGGRKLRHLVCLTTAVEVNVVEWSQINFASKLVQCFCRLCSWIQQIAAEFLFETQNKITWYETAVHYNCFVLLSTKKKRSKKHNPFDLKADGNNNKNRLCA